ncbi:hypothetical protein GCM10027275_49390 [Rhabdobacter roseus]|uniref:Acyl carrier protein n=1 Tax=Rhabdobacter roseus TaxID=1655419 RepID=A0A840U4I1_9BACT|nr:acyl carrier protein [Rhabdobacter roseus]MBB5287000.1 acyl carrier protein [Rhabdobacter roseus]
MKASLTLVRDHLSRRFGIPPPLVRLSSHLDNDLGLEIWEKIDLIVFLEAAYGVTFPSDATSRYETVFELLAFALLSPFVARSKKFFVK